MEQTNEQPTKPIQGSKNIWITLIAVIITALIVDGGVYAWQKSLLKNTEQRLQQQITTLQNQVSRLQQQIDYHQNQLDTKQSQRRSDTRQTNETCNNPGIIRCAKEGETCQNYGQGVGGGDNCLLGLRCDESGPDGTTGKCIKSDSTNPQKN
jgi:TolA-binding protein